MMIDGWGQQKHGMDPGVDLELGPGVGPGVDPGVDSGEDSGVDPGRDSGVDPGDPLWTLLDSLLTTTRTLQLNRC